MFKTDRKWRGKKIKPITGHREMKRASTFRTKKDKAKDRRPTMHELLNYDE